MTSAAKTSSAVSMRYAVALVDLAEEGKKLEAVEKDLGALRSMMAESSDLSILIRSPLVNRKKRNQALRAVADKAGFQDLTKNFLGVLGENRRLYAIDSMIDAFYRELSRRRGEVSVEVTTARDMTDKQLKDLRESISKNVGSEISLKAKVEPGILGGMIVTIGSRMIDDSVARKLERLKAAMSKQSNENLTSQKEVG